MPTTTATLEDLFASVDRPLAWAYGRHYVAGNLILRDDRDDGSTVLFVALGEGPWDAVEALWANGAEVASDHYHFHPGVDGVAGGSGVTGDQKADLWWPLDVSPALTYSKTAYVAVKIDDPEYAPTDDFSVLGRYRTRKVGVYNAAGSQTSFAWSSNPVWQIADVLRVGLYELTTRFNWQAFIDAAAYCDATVTVDSIDYPRFQAHHAFPQATSAQDALERMLAGCRGYLLEEDGLIKIVIDQPRSAAMTIGRGDIADGSFRHWMRDTSAAANRLLGKFRDVENDYAEAEEYVEREWHQALIGRPILKEIDFGAAPQNQVRRLLEYWASKSLDDARMVSLDVGMQAAALEPMDRVDVQLDDEAPWQGPKAFDVIEIADRTDGSRGLLLQEYDAAAFTDDGRPHQTVEGGVIVGPTTIPAPDVENFSATENPFVTPDGQTISRITYSFDKPSPLRTWAAMEVWGRRLDDMDAPIEEYHFLAKDDQGPGIIDWDKETHGEKLELQARSVSKTGRPNPGGPTTTVTLDQLPSAPAPVSDLWCQQDAQRLILSWYGGAETNLKGYAIYELGEIVPADDAAVAEKYRLGFAPHAGEGELHWWEFLERDYRIIASDGTVVELEAAGGIALRVDALIGRKITFLDPTGEIELTALDNDERTITFATGTAPTQINMPVRTRPKSGERHFYVRAQDSLDQLSTAKPVPPATLACFPFARDGSKDVGPPRMWLTASSFQGTQWSSGPLAAQTGHVNVWGAVRSAAEDESDFDLALKQNINGVSEWRVEIDISTTSAGPTTDTRVFGVPAANAPGNYYYNPLVGPPAEKFWILFEFLGSFYLPNVYIQEVRVQAKNAAGGWSSLTTARPIFMSPGQEYTGEIAGMRASRTVTPVSSVIDENPVQSAGTVQTVSVPAATTTYIDFPSTAPLAGAELRYRLVQGATPGTIIFRDANGGVWSRMGDRKVPVEADTTTWCKFYAVSATELELCRMDTFYA
ncbi:MAG: hypothetical protein GC160_03005 [Acidobacteria bacterium]|nr:hypothetical protein [Acidobacteriota bacterium]